MILNKDNILLFKKSHRIYNKTNASLEDDLRGFEFYGGMEFKWREENFLQSFKENFFTLLMISLLLKGCRGENIVAYSKIISCIRQIITSTDNIIDREDKGIMFFREMKNRVVKNTLLTMVSQNIIEKASVELMDSNVSREIINKIHRIAQAESKRDEEQYVTYPKPEYVKEVIHRGIGGELLEISMTAPRLVEGGLRLENYSKGLYKIGMGLQALDDLCDVDEDMREGKVNYAVAKLISEGYPLRELKKTGGIELDDEFKKSYIREVLGDTVEGFGILRENGFPLSKGDVNLLLKHLFKIRGLEEYWRRSA